MKQVNSHNGPSPEAVFAYGVSPSELIIGIDEVGRGAWAGPVTAAAVVMRAQDTIDGIHDSKKLSARQRHRLDRVIKSTVQAIGIGWVTASEVDAKGLSWAVVESGRRALTQLGVNDHRVFIDGSWNYPAAWRESLAIVKGDGLIVPIAAASIVAKVARDRYMQLCDGRFPGYGFSSHVGYGTARHRQALAVHGLTPLHRQTYKPLQEFRHVND